MTEPRVVVLTRAQRAVLGELTRDGPGSKTIAARLGITESAVRNRLKVVMRRTGHDNRTALVVDLLRGRLLLRTVDHRRRDHHERMSA